MNGVDEGKLVIKDVATLVALTTIEKYLFSTTNIGLWCLSNGPNTIFFRLIKTLEAPIP